MPEALPRDRADVALPAADDAVQPIRARTESAVPGYFIGEIDKAALTRARFSQKNAGGWKLPAGIDYRGIVALNRTCR